MGCDVREEVGEGGAVCGAAAVGPGEDGEVVRMWVGVGTGVEGVVDCVVWEGGGGGDAL